MAEGSRSKGGDILGCWGGREADEQHHDIMNRGDSCALALSVSLVPGLRSSLMSSSYEAAAERLVAGLASSCSAEETSRRFLLGGVQIRGERSIVAFEARGNGPHSRPSSFALR